MELLGYGEAEKSSSLGFMELLSMQDFGPSVFDVLQGALIPSLQVEPLLHADSPEVFMNAPTTPNSSSISSESTAGQNDEQTKERNIQLDFVFGVCGNRLKPKKTASQKRQREPRFAFMTKSEVDHLEDGYRWRKYGQKAVKNSPFPRSYYRCTTASCNVKKRVERSCNDPTIVVTTYEGQHTHPSPVMPRSPASVHALPPYSGFSAPDGPPNNTVSSGSQNLRFCSQSSALLTADHGLLQDVVPWSAIKKEE
ncbi:UNVERIFIED_CONTAM: WRKY transcription factor 71 [Sesamum calycinum]|uniref:WRKY transcription factor 71 n=1 Tax=Sesamum calycinum TaxID=2727403 RepID=A0AAW2SB03_9LAMI